MARKGKGKRGKNRKPKLEIDDDLKELPLDQLKMDLELN